MYVEYVIFDKGGKAMKANELMIGDYINYRGQIIKVTSLYDKGGSNEVGWGRKEDTWVNAINVEPIPLTPEILEKNGFVLKPDGWIWCGEEGVEEQDYIFIQFRKGCDEVRLVELNFVNNVLAKFRTIQFVHELQHALRLCGIDKKIVL